MLYIIRHGQTDWNKAELVQGQTDIPLNEAGIKMAREAAIAYKDIHFDVCFSSPLVRAYETARLMLDGRNINIITDDRLKEISFGEYEGSKRAVVDASNPVYPLFHTPESYQATGGAEGVEEICKRTGEFYLERVKPLLDDEKDVLIVGHGAMNCSLIRGILNLPVEDFWSGMTGNCKLLKITENGIEPGLEGEPLRIIKWADLLNR